MRKHSWMIIPIVWGLTAIISICYVVHAQSPDLKPTEVQQLRLEVKQKTAMLAQRDVTDAQTRFNQALGELQDEASQVEKANGWKDVQFDPQALTFKPMPKTEKK